MSFKPCYKWITFNTDKTKALASANELGFKPCYKWITFNTDFANIISSETS